MIYVSFFFVKMEELLTRGYTTVPIYDARDVGKARSAFVNILRHVPYFKDDSTIRVFGKFQAYADPWSMWNPIVLEMRRAVAEKVEPLLSRVYKTLGVQSLKAALLPDRVLIRPPHVPYEQKDAWHRDVMKRQFVPTGGNFVHLYGGWINLDDTPQYFQGVPGSHLHDGTFYSMSDLDQGLATLTKEEALQAEQDSNVVEIPPGHQFIFNQVMRHTIKKVDNPQHIVRLFTGFLVSDSSTWIEFPLGGNGKLETIMTDLELPLLPAGDKIPLYDRWFLGRSHSKSLPDKKRFRELAPLTPDEHLDNLFVPEYLGQFPKGPRYMPSYKEISDKTGIPMPPLPFIQEDINLMVPHPI